MGLSDISRGFGQWVGLKLLLGTVVMGVLAFLTPGLGVISLVFLLLFVGFLLVTTLVIYLGVRRMFDSGNSYDT